MQRSSFGKPSATARGQQLNQGDKLTERVEFQAPESAVGQTVGIRNCPVRPITWDSEVAVLGTTQDQRVDARDEMVPQQRKALSLERMKRMANLDPNRSVVG